MKKLILTMMFIFAVGFTNLINATTEKGENIFMDLFSDDCAQDAWDFGTMLGGGDPLEEYWWTNFYYEAFCEEQ